MVTPHNSSKNGAGGGSTATHLSPLSAAINVSPATPLPTPMTSPEGVNVMPVIKRDLVVRFTDKQNSTNSVVRCEMAAASKTGSSNTNNSTSGSATSHSADSSSTVAATMPPGAAVKYKDKYEVQHYSRHPHGPTSPCDSENSVCNRSRENLLGPGKAVR